MQEEKISPLIFSRTLRATMQARDLHQEDLVSKIGVSQGAVSGWFNETIPKGDMLYRLARCLGVSMEYLLTGVNAPPKWVALEPRPPNIEARRLLGEIMEKARKLESELKKY